MTFIKHSLVDRLLISADNGLRALFATSVSQRENPAQGLKSEMLLPSQRKQAGSLMRINHTGEVCAQALYYGQALVARSPDTKKTLLQAAGEETDHLVWCQERLQELKDRPSYLNPLWYFGSFSIGLIAGCLHDRWSLGFVVETERQVEKHLKEHLQQLPAEDIKSRRILEQMCEDESHHATVAIGAGAVELPYLIRQLIKVMSKVMTATAYYV